MYIRYSFIFIQVILVALSLTANLSMAATNIAVNDIKRIQVQFSVTKNGQPFANTKEVFTINNGSYTLESVTKGLGVYALLGERRVTSQGSVNESGLKPLRFELQQGDKAKKALLAEFDWAANILNMTVKGQLKTAPLNPGTQDLASIAYQFMYTPKPMQDTVSVSLTTGKKLSRYTYKVNPALVRVEALNAAYDTIQLTQGDADATNPAEEKSLWLSPAHYYLPMQMKVVDDAGVTLMQTLTSFTIE